MKPLAININDQKNNDKSNSVNVHSVEVTEQENAVYPRRRLCNLNWFLFIMVMVTMVVGMTSVTSYYRKGRNSPEKDTHDEWAAFKETHGKFYNSSEHEATHKRNFVQNSDKIKKHNKEFHAGRIAYKMELNQFSDQDSSTFSSIRNGLKLPKNYSPPTPAPLNSGLELPNRFDWRDTKKVSPVKDQGQCGSCWAFSATGALESQGLIHSRNFTTLSEQQIVDCDHVDHGCEGGFYTYAWDYVKQDGGLESDFTYPYSAGYTGSAGVCHHNASLGVAKVSGYNFVGTDVTDIMQTLMAVGPLSIAVNAGDFQHYSTGIISCSSSKINHAILLVGFGMENGQEYWWVKNSWSASWGLNGYAKVTRKVDSDCGVSDHAYYPTIV